MTFIIIGILVIVFVVFFIPQRFPARKRNLPRKFRNAELVQVLLTLEEEPLNELFRLYREKFGQGPAKYARQTYNKWKAGEVRPNKQTFNRFLVYLPSVMSFDLKCEVLRKLRAEYCAKDNYELDIHIDDWKETVIPLVNDIIEKAHSAELPEPLKQRLRWLSEDETHIASMILTESQAQESRNNMALLQQEFTNIKELLHNANGKGKITHLLKLPYGTITLKIKRK
jgi:hypothetical protein